MAEFPLAGLLRVLGPILSMFGQKLYVFVEVSIGLDKPYALTVLNRSNYCVLLEDLRADPDGFPDERNGWLLSDSKLFQKKLLQPGQRLRVYLAPRDIGKLKVRRFKLRYSTLLWGKRVPRSMQVADCEFPVNEHTVHVTSTLRLS